MMEIGLMMQLAIEMSAEEMACVNGREREVFMF